MTKTLQNPPKFLQSYSKPSKTLQNPSENSEKSENSENLTMNQKILNVSISMGHCNKEFSRKDNLKRHIEMRCKAHKKEEVIDYKEMFYLMKSELERKRMNLRNRLIYLKRWGNTQII